MSTILFGGSFDPVHRGHLQIADFARQAVGAARVLFIPASKPFHKPGYHTSAENRLNMLEEAVAPLPWADVCLYELQDSLQGKEADTHYTIDTLRFLQSQNLVEEHPFLLIGDDLASTFTLWKEYQTLARLVHVLIAVRDSISMGELDFPCTLLKNLSMIYASSEIRKAIAAKQPYRHSVPREVYRYIEYHQLYR